MENGIIAPSIDYGALSPMLIVFGAAVVAVLVEAFAPSSRRRGLQVITCVVGLLAAFVAVVLLAGTETLTIAGAIAIDGPTLFLQGTLVVLGLAGILLISEQSLDSSGGSVVASAATLPGSRDDVALAESTQVQTEVYPLALFSLGGMMMFPACNDLITLFIALEVLSLPLYLMAGLARRRRLLSQEAAVKYFLLGSFSSAFFLYGIALLYGYAAGTQLGDIRAATAVAGSNELLLYLGLGMLSVGLLFKVGAVPFQAWTPDVYQGSPTPVTALMAACTKVAAFGALLRVLYVAFGGTSWDWRPVFWAVAIATMVVGAVLAVTQTDVKRMLAYSSVAHTGFILVGVIALGDKRPVEHAVLPARLRLHDDRRVRHRHPGA
jgi:NADH-quinone oxidoreductase subunit N